MSKGYKMSKAEFLRRVHTRSGQSQAVVNAVYKATVDELRILAIREGRLTLTGFGTFYVQTHKGHPVQFGKKSDKIEDYAVFKFSASSVFNKSLRMRLSDEDEYEETEDETLERLGFGKDDEGDETDP